MVMWLALVFLKCIHDRFWNSFCNFLIIMRYNIQNVTMKPFFYISLFLICASTTLTAQNNIDSSKTGTIKVKKPQKIREIQETTAIFVLVEQMPQFGGGEADLFNYLAKNVKYPTLAKDSAIGGIVYVAFIINEIGEIEDARILRGIGFGCDEEALRVVMNMPRWNPGRQRGKPVAVQFNLPIRFLLR